MSSSSAHHLAERRAGALAAVGLADVERRGVVLVNDDPRIELLEVGIGIRTRAACAARAAERTDRRWRSRGADADDEQAGAS